MTTIKKPMMLSLFVLPGLGHLYLKEYALGALFCISALIATFFLISDVLIMLSTLFSQFQTLQIEHNPAAQVELILEKFQQSATESSLATKVLCVLWIASCVDLLRVQAKHKAKRA